MHMHISTNPASTAFPPHNNKNCFYTNKTYYTHLNEIFENPGGLIGRKNTAGAVQRVDPAGEIGAELQFLHRVRDVNLPGVREDLAEGEGRKKGLGMGEENSKKSGR